MKNVYLIRHAQSLSNVGYENTPEEDCDLTDIGRLQVDDLLKTLKAKSIKTIIHSSLQRSKQTAELIACHFQNVIIECWDVQEFFYLPLDASIDKNMRMKRKNKYWSNADGGYKEDKTTESFINFLQRVDNFLIQLESTNLDLPIAVISHKYFIKGILWSNLTKNCADYCNPQRFYEFCNTIPFANGSIVNGILDSQKLFVGEIKTNHFLCEKI